MGNLITGAVGALQAYQTAKLQKNLNNAQHVINDANTYATNTVGQAQTDAQNLLGQTYADATNAVRSATNSAAAAQAALGNMQRSIKNQQAATQAGQQWNTLATNLARSAQAMTEGSISQRLQASQQTGALRAALSNSGTGGATSSQLLSALNVRQSQAQASTDMKNNQRSYDGLMQQMGLEANRETNYDFGQSIANINYAQEVYSPKVWTDVISPIQAGDFAMSDTEQAGAAFAGSGGWQAAVQGYTSLYGQNNANTSSRSSTGSNSWGFTSDYGSSSYNYSNSDTANYYSSNYAGPSATYGFGDSGYSYSGSNNSFGFSGDL